MQEYESLSEEEKKDDAYFEWNEWQDWFEKRKLERLSHEKFAIKLNVVRPIVSKWEKGIYDN